MIEIHSSSFPSNSPWYLPNPFSTQLQNEHWTHTSFKMQTCCASLYRVKIQLVSGHIILSLMQPQLFPARIFQWIHFIREQIYLYKDAFCVDTQLSLPSYFFSQSVLSGTFFLHLSFDCLANLIPLIKLFILWDRTIFFSKPH